jgi:hypothetical protein
VANNQSMAITSRFGGRGTATSPPPDCNQYSPAGQESKGGFPGGKRAGNRPPKKARLYVRRRMILLPSRTAKKDWRATMSHVFILIANGIIATPPRSRRVQPKSGLTYRRRKYPTTRRRLPNIRRVLLSRIDIFDPLNIQFF